MWNWNTHRHENIQVLSCQSSTHRSVEAVSGLQEAQDHILYSPAIHLMVAFHFTLSTHRNCTRAYATSPSKSQRTMGMIWLTPSSTPTEKDGSSNLVKSHPENMLKQWTFFMLSVLCPAVWHHILVICYTNRKVQRKHGENDPILEDSHVCLHVSDIISPTNSPHFCCLSILGGRVKTWKRRWFILTDNCLYYFEYTTVRPLSNSSCCHCIFVLL